MKICAIGALALQGGASARVAPGFHPSSGVPAIYRPLQAGKPAIGYHQDEHLSKQAGLRHRKLTGEAGSSKSPTPQPPAPQSPTPAAFPSVLSPSSPVGSPPFPPPAVMSPPIGSLNSPPVSQSQSLNALMAPPSQEMVSPPSALAGSPPPPMDLNQLDNDGRINFALESPNHRMMVYEYLAKIGAAKWYYNYNASGYIIFPYPFFYVQISTSERALTIAGPPPTPYPSAVGPGSYSYMLEERGSGCCHCWSVKKQEGPIDLSLARARKGGYF